MAVESSGAVVIRALVTRLDSLHMARHMKEPSSSWCVGGFEFLVCNAALPWADVDAQSAQASFGLPRRVAVVGPHHVVTWAHDLSPRADGSYAPRVSMNRWLACGSRPRRQAHGTSTGAPRRRTLQLRGRDSNSQPHD